jgi:alpha-beta hydrolase superfamily lysophospholipase
MNTETFEWKNGEGLRIHTLEWRVQDPRAVIALVHGQGEHSGRYFQLANWYNAQGIGVIAFDQQGYGRSEGRRGFAKSYDVLLDDIEQFLEIVHERYRGRTLFLYGHSMGGNLCMNYVLKRRTRYISGIISTSPWIKLPFDTPSVKEVADRLIRSYTPTLILPTGLAVHFLSHDQEIVEMYKFDPYVHDKLDARTGLEILEAGLFLDTYKGAFPLPLLLMHGEEDRITDCAASRAFAKRVKDAVTYKEWPDMYHELHNEIGCEKVYQFTLNWMESRMKGEGIIAK